VFIRTAHKTSWDWIYEEHAKSRTFLAEASKTADVFVTHHIPSHKAVSPRWVGSQLNPFFVGDVTDIIESISRPTTWLFGHTHDPGQFKIGQADLIVNPLGYPGEKKALGFVDKLVLEIGK
jgi:Icc-related predicted phosphoesterase